MANPVFAAIGHQQDWPSVIAMIDGLRQRERPGAKLITTSEAGTLLDFIPPRVTSRFRVGGYEGQSSVEAFYVETFIRPDELHGRPAKNVLKKVYQAIEAAYREGAQIAALGGFTSILVESGAVVPEKSPVLTSGNTLTAALILRGVERALTILNRDLAAEDILVIGATGDIGSAVSRWLAGRCRNLILAARNIQRLEHVRNALDAFSNIRITNEVNEALTEATLVIAVASTTDSPFSLERCRPGTILCDAGYPKNLSTKCPPEVRLFHAGMGLISGGVQSHDGLLECFYCFPVPNIAHGCLLEGAVLALAGRIEAFSEGRGRITPNRIDEMWSLAMANGVRVAPLFNAHGLWAEECVNA